MWETQAEHLLTEDNGTVCGVQARKSDGLMTKVRGKKVMLACGGFEGNREMYSLPLGDSHILIVGRLGRYVGPRTEHLELIAPGLKYNTGFGLKMGLEVGAAVREKTPGVTKHIQLLIRIAGSRINERNARK